MNENISYELSETERNNDISFSKLYDDFLNNDYDTEYDNNETDQIMDICMAYKLDYNTNYTVVDLKKIIEFYDYHLKNKLNLKKRKKDELIETIIDFEMDPENIILVNRRKQLWFYLKELKSDKYLSKYIIFN
tara:strand:+ start:7418 stop:7816 length:399 start_codon:yes stop_codon:yes gene_type:complete